MCSAECGLDVRESPGGGLGLRGTHFHPVNNGKLCPKASLAETTRCAKERLITPLKLIGKRGGGRYVSISWKQAFLEIGARLRKLGIRERPESLLLLFGEKADHDPFYLLANAIGTPNVNDHNSLCDTSRRLAFSLTLGSDQERPLADLYRPLHTDRGIRELHDCRLLVIFGANPAAARRFFWEWEGIKAAKKEGMRLVVVDPYRNETAGIADDWLPIRPGTDAALLLSIIRYIIEHDREDGTSWLAHSWIARNVSGWDRFKREILTSEADPANGLPKHSLEWAADFTGINVTRIEALAREMGATKPMAIIGGMNGISHYWNGFTAARAIAALASITGNLDVPGGFVLRHPSPLRRLFTPSANDLRHKDRAGHYPLAAHGVTACIPFQMLEGVETVSGRYPINAMFILHHNPVLTAPESRRWRESLMACDARGKYLVDLVVFSDTVANETATFADYILPMRHFLERQGVVLHETPFVSLSLREMVATPLPGTRSPLDVALHLAKELNVGDAFRGIASDDDWCDRVLAGTEELDGESPLHALRTQGGHRQWPFSYQKPSQCGFATPSGKLELYPDVLADTPFAGFSFQLTPALRARGDGVFHVVTGRTLEHCHSFTTHFQPIGRGERFPPVQINNEDAHALGLSDGQRVALINDEDIKIEGVLVITPLLCRGVIRARYGWGDRSPFLSGLAQQGYNLNELTSARLVHPVSGNACFGELVVRLEKADG